MQTIEAADSKLAKLAGTYAIVTGAAQRKGLGAAIARQLAAQGLNLILVDILADEVKARAEAIGQEFGVDARSVCCDLSAPAPYGPLEQAVAGLEIGVLVCNHMFTPADTPMILDMPLETHSAMIDINARAYINLIHRFGGDMRSAGRGAIILVASGAGLTSAPYTAAYSANKAFQIATGEALWFELQGTGVDVLTIAAGMMATKEDGSLDKFPKWMMAQPDDVARCIAQAVGKKHMVVPGFANAMFLFVQTKLQSRRRTLQQIGGFMTKGLGK